MLKNFIPESVEKTLVGLLADVRGIQEADYILRKVRRGRFL